MKRRTRGAIALLLMMAAAVAVGQPARPARVWFDALQAGLDRIEAQLPGMGPAVDAAAARLVAGAELGVRGDRGLAMALGERAGAMWQYRGGAGGPGDVVLTAGEGTLTLGVDGEVGACAIVLAEGDAPPGLASTLRRAAAWTVQCELFAACVRRGETPIVRQSLLVDTRRDRLVRYGEQRFHHDRYLEPIPPGELGRRYLAGLRAVLRDYETASGADLMAAARRVRQARQRGGTAWLRTAVHGLAWHTGGQLPGDPGVLMPLTADLDTSPWRGGENDVVVLLGDHEAVGGDGFGRLDALGEAGLGVVWVVSASPSDRRWLRRRDVLVDLWAPWGDGVVRVEHYDAALGPVSGVLAEAAYWMISVEAAAR